MSSNLQEKGLRAAAAVTGCGRRALKGSVPIGLALVAQLVGCQSAPQPSDEPLVDTSNPPQVEQPTPAPVCDQENLQERVSCCEELEFEAEGCEVCDPYIGEGRVEIEGCISHYMINGPQTLDLCRETILKHHPDADDAHIMASCTPWGPPAPPVMGALTLRQLLELEEVA